MVRCGLSTDDARLLIKPSGRFVIGRPQRNAGLTGRKNIVDTFGRFCGDGGGAFIGTVPSKVDISGGYAIRWGAKT